MSAEPGSRQEEPGSRAKNGSSAYLRWLLPPMLTAIFIAAILTTCQSFPDSISHKGEEAREAILACGVPIPASAKDLFHAYEPQFAQHLDTWISFTASPADCTSVATALANAKAADPKFFPFKGAERDAPTEGPRGPGLYIPSPDWNIFAVNKGMAFKAKGFFVLVDNDAGRIYIALRADPHSAR
jgi:hypothetical protein